MPAQDISKSSNNSPPTEPPSSANNIERIQLNASRSPQSSNVEENMNPAQSVCEFEELFSYVYDVFDQIE